MFKTEDEDQEGEKDKLSKTSVPKRDRNESKKMLTIVPAREKKSSLE